jgi:hypothetical protein
MARSRSASERRARPAAFGRAGALAALALLLGAARADDASKAVPEYDVKAAFLYRFTQYVEWPASAFESPSAPLVIGVLGEDPFGPSLDRTIEGRTSQGRGVVARRLRSADEATACHALFVARSAGEDGIGAARAALEGKPVLIVSDIDGSARKGASIGFVIVRERIRFEVNVAVARKAGLKISSRLLDLATKVIASDEGG